MDRNDIDATFESLTAKQQEAIRMASQHLTSKQIAKALGVAPITIDKRIDAVRAKLGGMSRIDVLRHYRAWSERYGLTIDDPSILTDSLQSEPTSEPQPLEMAYQFEDSFAVDARASWDDGLGWLRPGIKPSDLGARGKVLLMLAGAVAIMIVAVLSMAFANALKDML